MAKPINLLLLSFFLFNISFAGAGDSCEIILKGFKKTDGFIIFRNSQDVEGQLTPISLTGQKKRTLVIPCPVMFYSADITCKPFFLKPGDKLVITKNSGDYFFNFENDKIRTNEQNLLWKISKILGPIYGSWSKEDQVLSNSVTETKSLHSKGLQTVNLDSEHEQIKVLFEKRIAFIHDFEKNETISEYFSRYLQKYFYYSYLKSALKIYNFQKLPPSLLNNIKQTLISDRNDTSLLQIDPYRGFLNAYNFVLQQSLKCSDNLCILQEVTDNFEGAARDYLLFQQVKRQFNDMDSSVQDVITYFDNSCTSKKYLQIISHEVKLARELSDNVDSEFIFDEDLNKSNFSNYLKKKRDNVIVVVFWASWCYPCIREMPSLKELLPKLSKGKTTFLFLSMDRKANDWLSAYKRFPFMNTQNSFLLKNNFRSELARQYSIKSIPRIMIIGKNNMVVSKDAPSIEQGLENLIRRIEGS